MKLKSVPEDFVVTEQNGRQPGRGAFAMYRLDKTSIGTHEAVADVARTWNLAPGSVVHAGLKDRHAVTSQVVTIRNGPRSDHVGRQWRLSYLGQTGKPIAAEDIQGNQFRIVIRHLTHQQVEKAVLRTDSISAAGCLNYFDQQRFGSLTSSGRFAAERWCKKDYETAVWLALAEYNSHDDRDERKAKACLRNSWGDWSMVKALLPRSHRRSVVTYLCDHPKNFRKAFALVNAELRGLLLSAFQSEVWNCMLKTALLNRGALDAAVGSLGAHCLTIGASELPFPTTLPEGLPQELSLPSGRKQSMDSESVRLANQALQRFHMTVDEMKLSFPRDRWFSRGPRLTVVQPDDLDLQVADDEHNAGRRAAILSFHLPRGCYATMLVKSVFAEDMS